MGVSNYYCCICRECVNENFIPHGIIITKEQTRLYKKYGKIDTFEYCQTPFRCKNCNDLICSFCVCDSIDEDLENETKYKFIDKAIKKYCNIVSGHLDSNFLCDRCRNIEKCPHCGKNIK